MSISTVVTRGYGSFAGVNFVPPRGYIEGPIPPPSVTSVPGPSDGTEDKRYKLPYEELTLLLMLMD